MLAAFVTRAFPSLAADKITTTASEMMANRANKLATHAVKELGTGYAQTTMQNVVTDAMKQGLHKLSENQTPDPKTGMARSATFSSLAQASAMHSSVLPRSISTPMFTSLLNPTRNKPN